MLNPSLILDFLRKTLIGGGLFLLPVIVIVILVSKLVQIVAGVGHKLTSVLGVGPAVLAGGAVILAILLCFFAGLAATRPSARKLLAKVEDAVLGNLPGYTLMKSAAADMAGNLGGENAHGSMRPVLAWTGSAWQFGFTSGAPVAGQLVPVFVPGTPSPMSGDLFLLNPANVIETELTSMQVMNCLKGMGRDAGKLVGALP